MKDLALLFLCRSRGVDLHDMLPTKCVSGHGAILLSLLYDMSDHCNASNMLYTCRTECTLYTLMICTRYNIIACNMWSRS